MTKKELIEEVKKVGEVTNKEAEKFIDIVLDSIKLGIKKEDKVKLAGFGTFTKKHKKARERPDTLYKTGTIHIPAHNVIKFKVSKEFLEFLN